MRRNPAFPVFETIFLVFLFGGSGLVAFASPTGSKGLGALLFLLAALAIVSGVRRASDRSPRLILSPSSFATTIANHFEIRWADLAEARTVLHDDTTYLILRLIDPAAAPQPPTLYNRPSFDRPPEAADEDILLPVDALDTRPEEILREIRARIAASRSIGP